MGWLSNGSKSPMEVFHSRFFFNCADFKIRECDGPAPHELEIFILERFPLPKNSVSYLLVEALSVCISIKKFLRLQLKIIDTPKCHHVANIIYYPTLFDNQIKVSLEISFLKLYKKLIVLLNAVPIQICLDNSRQVSRLHLAPSTPGLLICSC